MNYTKKCNKCQRELSESMFTKHKHTKDGLETTCKDCQREYRKQNKQRIDQYNKQYWVDNSQKLIQENKIRYYENADQRKDYARQYYSDNKEHCLQRAKQDRELNPDKHKAWRDKYRKSNPGKVNAYTARRRLKVKQATPQWANLKIIEQLYIEAANMSANSNELYEVDHIVPINGKFVCGLHCEDNLRIITKQENMNKHNLLLENLISDEIN